MYHCTALEVCEGQELDMAFETRDTVALEEYMETIRSRRPCCSPPRSTWWRSASDDATRNALYEFGLHVGLAFQLQDDYLDAFGNPENFGKQVGGDILADKKTFLLIRALEKAQGADLEALQAELGAKQDGKVERVLDLYRRLGVDAELRDAMAGQVALAEGALAEIQAASPGALAGSDAALALLHGVAEMVTARPVEAEIQSHLNCRCRRGGVTSRCLEQILVHLQKCLQCILSGRQSWYRSFQTVPGPQASSDGPLPVPLLHQKSALEEALVVGVSDLFLTFQLRYSTPAS